MTGPVHLSKFERIILNGAEWRLAAQDWVVLQLCEGIAYAIDSKAGKELPLGGVIVCPPNSQVTLTASVLGRARFRGMAIRVGSLTGFLTAPERQCLETEVARQCAPFLTLPADHALAGRVTQIFAQTQPPTLSSRLAFAQTFAELVEPLMHVALKEGMENEENQMEAKGRLRHFIRQIPESELTRLSLGELAKQLHCCERHVSRLFREEWGTSFPSYVSDIRLKKACQLLLQGNLKIIDVALESGHGSLAQFNYVFKRRFHKTPTEWREQQMAPPRRPARARPLQLAAVMVCLLLNMAGISWCLGAEGAGGSNTNAACSLAVGRDSVEPSHTNTVASTNAPPAQAAVKIKMDRYEVTGNTLLATNVISRLLAPYTSEAVDMDGFIGKLTNAMGALQLEYFRRGYVTVKVSFPPQVPTNGVVILRVTEGKLAAVRILHNRYFSSNNIMASLPYVKTLESGDRILNSKIFQTELDRANSNPDRQISSEVRPGPEPGTSALILDVKDRLPLHGRVDLDNYSPPGTPELRVNANASYGNLWDLEHTLGLQYGFSPELMKPTLGDGTHVSLNPLDAPTVAYYSGFYRAPFGSPAEVESQIAQNPNNFGYNETTRQFVQPPAIGRPEFTAYASRSTTGPTIFGPVSQVVDTSLLKIDQQLSTQQYTSQTTAGGRLSFPLPAWQGIQSSWSVGMDYKEDKVVSLPTNNFYYTTIVTHGAGAAPPTVTRSSIAIGGVETYPSLQYTPFFLGWTGSRQDHWGQMAATTNRWSEFDGGLSLVAGTGGTFSRDRPFPLLIANSPEATTEFVAVRPQLSRTQVLPGNFTLFGSMTGQWANEPLLNLEQFELGGNASVRGYREGELYADTGWVGQLELRSPIYWRGASKQFGTQLTAFTDYGEGYLLDQRVAPNAHQALWGTGVGVNFHFGPYVESHILIAWPLLNSAFTTAGHERISFSLSAQL
jgi:hemolysin activation/secretion protein/AraC-like DNA-binding protein